MTGGTILMTAPSEAIRGEAVDFMPELKTCYHFNGLYYGEDEEESGAPNERQFMEDVIRLTGIVNNLSAEVVIFGNTEDYILRGTLEAAQFLVKHTHAHTCLIATVKGVHLCRLFDVQLFTLTEKGLKAHPIRTIHSNEFFSLVLDFAVKVRDGKEILK